MARYCFLFLSSVLLSTNLVLGDLKKDAPNFIRLIESAEMFTEDFIEDAKQEVVDSTPEDQEEYDFVVVGAGASGAVIAARLSEEQNASVLLIERGGHEQLVMDIPALAIFLMYNPFWHWNYYSEPSRTYCLGFKNRQCRMPVGQVMGGSSSVNWMIATRGNRYDYDEWAEITGDDSWAYDNMLKYFKKLEKFEVNLTEYEDQLHNFDGPVNICNVQHRTPLVDAFVEAGHEMGFPPLDYNGRKQTGFSYVQTNQVNGERLSSNRAYLHSARARPNLKLSMHSHVNKILIDPSTKRAYGVELTKHDLGTPTTTLKVIARKEVILCAGAIGTPKLLMLSGIGPAEHLKSHRIPVLKDARVGKNLMDHIAYGGLTFLVNDTVSLDIRSALQVTRDEAFPEYFENRTGPGTVLSGIEGLGYINTDDLNADNERPNIEFMFGGVHVATHPLLHIPFKFQEKHWVRYFKPNTYEPGWLIWPMLMKPKSRGEILLRSTDPKDTPKIITNYLTDPDDVRVSVKGIRVAIEVSKTQAMQKYGTKLYDKIVPGCERHQYDSDKYWECALRTYTITLWHFSGTCRMGRDDDDEAVVDSRGLVKGIQNLRVADASIMPVVPTAHLNVPTMAVAEAIADKVKAHWRYI
ncbi:glucose dehydrogenase [FAD, quinone]-like [Trichogramma pretiosum]|uniref:glucose dehydrogenase [FAD, quinone]-like n=1 Tax=Trichogramma pretiosum TaxID=7493 RepID=UPI0006C95C4E|nr:glucose dehydrogenase [FAD, quinone]-like [Trichogramma pretiosum]